jgi:hypothetical protein
MFIEKELTIVGPFQDALDVQPRGEGCWTLDPSVTTHEFFIKTQAAGFTYRICGRCGTVRIVEMKPGENNVY